MSSLLPSENQPLFSVCQFLQQREIEVRKTREGDRERGRGIRKRRLRRQSKKRRSLFLLSRHFVSCQKMCCLFKVTWPRLRSWFTEPNYFSPRATGSVCLWKEREEETKGKEGGRGKERKRQKRVGKLVCALPLQRKGPGQRKNSLASSPHALLSPPSSWVKLGKFLQRLELHTSGWVWLSGYFLNNAFVCFFFFFPLDFLSLSVARVRKRKERHFWLQYEPILLSTLNEDND